MAVVCNFRLRLQSVDSLYGNMKDADVIGGLLPRPNLVAGLVGR